MQCPLDITLYYNAMAMTTNSCSYISPNGFLTKLTYLVGVAKYKWEQIGKENGIAFACGDRSETKSWSKWYDNSKLFGI